MKTLIVLLALTLHVCAYSQLSEITSMHESRQGHSMCVLDNGKVLITGGYGDFTYRKSAEIGESGVWNWTLTDDMSVRRYSHTSHAISGNRALIIGGWDGESTNHSSTEIYLSDIGAWEDGPDLTVGRSNHRSTVLGDGKILITGGFDGSVDLSSCDLYDPVAETISPTGSMNYARSSHVLTVLSDGKVLASGGFNPNLDFQMDECEIYDPTTGEWTVVASMHDARDNHACTLLSDGKVMATGGRFYNSAENWFEGLDSYEIYDPTSDTWSTPEPIGQGYSYHHLFNFEGNSLPLIFGGTDHSGNGVDLTYNSTVFWLQDQWNTDWDEWSGSYRYAAAQIDGSTGIVTGGQDDNRAWIFDTSTISIDETSIPQVSIYPNPTDRFITVVAEGVQSFELYNAFGQVVLSSSGSQSNVLKLDLTDLASGTYVLRIRDTHSQHSHVILR